MLSMMRSNLYRLVKTRFTWVFVVICLACVYLSVLSTWIMVANSPASSVSFTAAQMYGSAFSGGMVPLFASVLLASFLSADFKTKSIKNVVQAKGGRASYALAAAVTIFVICIALAIVCSAVAEIAYRSLGFTITDYDAGALIPLFVQVILVSAAYSSIIALIVFASGSETLGVVAAILIASGLVEALLRSAFLNVFSEVPFLRDCLDGYLASQLSGVGSGTLSDAGGFIAAAVTIVVAIGACVAVMRRRELAP